MATTTTSASTTPSKVLAQYKQGTAPVPGVTPIGYVPAIVAVCHLLGASPATPNAPWRGLGMVVKLQGGHSGVASAYANSTNVDLRFATAAQATNAASQLTRVGLTATVKGGRQPNYVRVALATRTAPAPGAATTSTATN